MQIKESLQRCQSVAEAVDLLIELCREHSFDKQGVLQIETEQQSLYYHIAKGIAKISPTQADTVLQCTEQAAKDLLSGKLKPNLALLFGKVKLKGDKDLLLQIKKQLP